jgi:2'-5' RNA ligase
MTLVFLGRSTPEGIGCFEQVAENITAKPFTLKLNRIGYWKRPKVLWSGPDVCPEPLSQLVIDLQHTLRECGFRPEKRAYKPHVTLARKANEITANPLVKPLFWNPNRFVLAGSTSSSNSPRYRVINQWDIMG